MNEKIILRKESFGGRLIDIADGKAKSRFLDAYEFGEKRSQLETGTGPEVKIFDATEMGYPLRTDSLSSPEAIFMEVTKLCNGSCTYCFAESVRKPDAREMKFGEIRNMLEQLSDVGGFYVRLTGGEPTMRDDFYDILDVISDEGMIAGINTNGLYDERKLLGILERGVKDIRVSLDGPEKVNDALRGTGTYKIVHATLKNIAEYNKTAAVPADPTINVVLMESNQKYIENMIELASGLGFKISFGLLRPSGKADISEMLSPHEVVSSAYRVQKMRKKLGLGKGDVRINYDIFCEPADPARLGPYPFDNSKCPLGLGGIGISAYGNLSGCGYLDTAGDKRWKGEDIRGKNIMDVWNESEMLNELRKIERDGCKSCEYHKSLCNGGCPATAYAITGDIDGIDPYCVRDVDFKIIKGNIRIGGADGL